MAFFRSKIFIAITCLSLGFFSGLYVGFDISSWVKSFFLPPEFGSLQSMNQQFLQHLNEDGFFPGINSSLTGVTVREDETHTYYELEAEDLDEKSLNISIENGNLTIQGEKKVETSFGSSISSFSRSFPIGENFKINQADIKYENNKIIIVVPKKAL